MVENLDLERRVGRVEAKLDALSESVDARFDAVDARFDAVSEAIAEQRRYTEFAYERLAGGMAGGFQQLTDRFDTMDKRFDRLERKLDRFLDLHLPGANQ